ncbi:MAG: right-handed parallel beta-helix repeat-containing protein [Candidatus Saganbacteria bacterium]|nr:right-handed parallel beta-helix repeat-containing protein [Candidatus Saganbacteria bacterium]
MRKTILRYICAAFMLCTISAASILAATGAHFAITLSVLTPPSAPNVVTNCNDSGPGSLREVLTYASTVAATVVIFDITTAEAGYSTGEAYPGLVTVAGNSWFRIVVNSVLPSISQSNIYIYGSSQTREASNTLGPKIEIKANSASFYGLTVTADNCTIEGLSMGGFTQLGCAAIRFDSTSQGNNLKGCYLGVSPTGEGSIANFAGLSIAGINADGHQIGGPATSDSNRIMNSYRYGIIMVNAGFVTVEGNVISGNGVGDALHSGIYMQSSDNNRIIGNIIGLDPTGMTDLGNNRYGIYLRLGSDNNIIGGSTEAERNIISGNDNDGIFIDASNGNEICGNYIGTDINGMVACGNSQYGIAVSGTTNNVIDGNIISGNNYSGIYLAGASGNLITNNYIGTDKNGSTDLGNTFHGIYTYTSSSNTIESNIISGNDQFGAFFTTNSYSNEVKNNYIGVGSTGGSLGNGSYGLYVNLSSHYNQFGPNNWIANNASDGIRVAVNVQCAYITRNTIEANSGAGIYLESGANNDIAYPTIILADYDGSQYTTVSGTSPVSSTIEIFKTETTPGGDNQGEGRTWLKTVTAEASGSWIGTVEGVSSGDKVTATASLFSGESGYTSEFAINMDVHYDGIGPTVTVESPDGGEQWMGSTTYEVTWAATDESGIDEIRLYYTTGSGWTVIATGEANDGAYSWLTPAINSSTVRVSVEAIDSSAQHNHGTDASAADFTIDSNGPSTPNLITPANGTTVTDTTPTLTWEASADSLTGIASYEIHFDLTLITQDATTAFTLPAPLADGCHTWEVRARDGAGNWGAYSTTFTFEVNSSIPAVSSIVLRDLNTGSQIYTNDRMVSLEALGVSGSPIEMIISQSGTFSGASWQAYLNPTTFEVTAGDGGKTVYYKLRDADLDESSTVEALITLDMTSPEAPTLIAPTNNSYTNEVRPVFSWDPVTDAVSGIASYEITINSPLIVATLGAVTTYTPTIDLPEGFHSWAVRAKDGAQNWGAESLTWGLTIDATAPTVDLITPEGALAFGAFAGPATIEWTANDVQGLALNPITLRFSSDSGASWTLIQSGLANNGSYSWTLPAVTLPNCRVSVEAVDLAGNKGEDSSAGDFTIDALTPEATLISAATNVPLTGEVVISFNRAMDVAGVAARFLISPEVTGTIAWSSGNTVMTFGHTALFDYNTVYSVTITAGATSVFGNPMPQQTLTFRTIPRDSEPPEISIKISDLAIKKGDFIDKDSRFDIVLTDNLSLDADSIRVAFDGTEAVFFIGELTDKRIAISYTPSTLIEGVHAIAVSVSDIAGNTTTKEVTDLTVSTGPIIAKDIIVHPMPMAPGRGQTGKIAYILSKDADIRIIMYGLSGELVWNRYFAEGSNGGKAGYNEVEFSGVSDISQTALANGIYVFRLLSDGKAIGKGHIVIYD